MQNNLKAIVALVGVALASFATVIAPNGGGLDDISTEGWLYIAGSVLGAGALVYLADNIPGVFGGAIKALIAGGGTFVASLTAAYQADQVLSSADYLLAASAAIAVLVGTYQVDEGPPPTA